MANLADLKKSLSDCHLKSDDRKTKFLLDIEDRGYFLNRIREILESLEGGEDIDANTKLAIQLLNIYRVKFNGSVQTERQPPVRTGSGDSGEDNRGTPSG